MTDTHNTDQRWIYTHAQIVGNSIILFLSPHLLVPLGIHSHAAGKHLPYTWQHSQISQLCSHDGSASYTHTSTQWHTHLAALSHPPTHLPHSPGITWQCMSIMYISHRSCLCMPVILSYCACKSSFGVVCMFAHFNSVAHSPGTLTWHSPGTW